MKLNYLLFLIALCFSIFFLFFTVSAITVDITATVPGCGDGVIGGGEQCDGSDLGGASCSSRGFTGGSLSCTSACVFNASQCTTSSGGGGGGGGGGSGGGMYSTPTTSVVLSGRAYPLSKVVVLKDGQIAVSTIAGPDARFNVAIAGLTTGNYIFAVYGEDTKGIRSILFTFPISITTGVTVTIGSIFIAPSIAVDKTEVKRGDTIAIFGQSTPMSEITVSVNSEEEFFVKKISDASGAYLLNFDTSVLEMGRHSAKSKVALNGEISPFSKVMGFSVGIKNTLAQVSEKTASRADLNGDKKINLVDFSIAAYWYKRLNPPASSDLNKDGKVDLVDFSIMAFNWTG